MNRVAHALVAIGSEFAGLFVEDRLFALAIAAWIGAIAVLFRFAHDAHEIFGYVLFTGLATILLASIVRATRR